MPEITIIPSVSAHVREMSGKLRPDDEREILSAGLSTSRALFRSFKGSIFPKTAFVDGDIAAMWGTAGTPLGRIGQPWLLTTSAVHNISPLKFARIYQVEVLKMLEIFHVLVNYVDSRYTAAIRLLDIVGFEIGEPEPYGPHNTLFRKFEKRI